MYVSKLNLRFDMMSLKNEVRDLINKFDYTQIGLTHTLDCPEEKRYLQAQGSLFDQSNNRFRLSEKDFCVFNKELEGSYIHYVYKSMPFNVGRMRIMVLKPNQIYSMHKDFEDRYHIAIQTHLQAKLVYIDNQTYNIPDDGYLYKIDATIDHTAFNSHKDRSRIHLVMCEAIA